MSYLIWPLYFGAAVLSGLSIVRLIWKFTSGKYKIKEDLTGKIILITGGTAGIGLETARELSKHGATVFLLCRSVEKAKRVALMIHSETNRAVHVIKLDTSKLSSVRECTREVLQKCDKIHVLINNAGRIGVHGKKIELSEDGLELTAATNYFGHFLLTLLLLDRIKESAPSRIINVSSLMHAWVSWVSKGAYAANNLNFENQAYDEALSYGYSKLSQVLQGRLLAMKLHGTGVTVNSLHPGIVRTSIIDSLPNGIAYFANAFMFLWFKNGKEGAQTSIYLAAAKEVENVTGGYFADCKPSASSLISHDMQLAEEIFRKSCQLTGIEYY